METFNQLAQGQRNQINEFREQEILERRLRK
jgi:hypothetical protein